MGTQRDGSIHCQSGRTWKELIPTATDPVPVEETTRRESGRKTNRLVFFVLELKRESHYKQLMFRDVGVTDDHLE